jgi:hypothetical protein
MAHALTELAHDHLGIQSAITACGGTTPLIELINTSESAQPKEEAAGVRPSLT